MLHANYGNHILNLAQTEGKKGIDHVIKMGMAERKMTYHQKTWNSHM